jgi:hypothetical protein
MLHFAVEEIFTKYTNLPRTRECRCKRANRALFELQYFPLRVYGHLRREMKKEFREPPHTRTKYGTVACCEIWKYLSERWCVDEIIFFSIFQTTRFFIAYTRLMLRLFFEFNCTHIVHIQPLKLIYSSWNAPIIWLTRFLKISIPYRSYRYNFDNS